MDADAPATIGTPTPVGMVAPVAPPSDVVMPEGFSQAPVVDPGWTMAPVEVDGVFLGVAEGVETTDGDVSTQIRAVDSDGIVLWEVDAPPGASLTTGRTPDGAPVALLATPASPGATPSAVVVDVVHGGVLAGPVDLPGPVVGPGFVVDDGGTRLALDATTALPRPGLATLADGETVLLEDGGTVLTAAPGRLPALGPDDAELWTLSADELGLEAGATPVAVAGAEPPAGTAVVGTPEDGALVDLATGTVEAVGVRDARRDVSLGHLVALGVRTVSAHRAGEVLWSGPTTPDSRLGAVGGALLYLREGEAVRVLNSLTGAHAQAWDSPGRGGLGVPSVMSSKGAAALWTDRWVVLTVSE